MPDDRSQKVMKPLLDYRWAWGAVTLPFLPIIALFLRFPVPPIVDLVGHVAVSLAPAGYNSQFYIERFGVTYRTFHLTMRLAQLIVGKNFAALCAIAMLMMTGVLLAAPALYAHLRGGPGVAVAAVLTGPAFLMMHSQQFVWGLFAYILAGWLSVLASFALLRADCELRLPDGRPGDWIAAGASLALLAAYAHPIGFFYLSIGLGCLWLRLLFVRAGEVRRLALLGGLSLVVIVTSAVASGLIGSTGSLQMVVGVTDLGERVRWLAQGGPYETSMLVLRTEYFGPRWSWYMSLITALPFACLIGEAIACGVHWRRRNLLPWSAMLLALLTIACGLVLLAPEYYGMLSLLPARHMTFTHPLTLMALVDLIPTAKRHLQKLLLLASVVSLSAVALFVSPYREAQDIQTVAAAAAMRLDQAVTIVRLQGGIAGPGPVVVSYILSNMGRTSWFHYRLVPFLLMFNERLLEHNIGIQHEWEGNRQLPTVLNRRYLDLAGAHWVVWDTTTFPQVTLKAQ